MESAKETKSGKLDKVLRPIGRTHILMEDMSIGILTPFFAMGIKL